MKKLYIFAKSKTDLNRRIAEGEDVWGIEYNIFNPEGYITIHYLKNIQEVCTIAIYRKTHKNEAGEDVPKTHVWGSFRPTTGGGTYIY